MMDEEGHDLESKGVANDENFSDYEAVADDMLTSEPGTLDNINEGMTESDAESSNDEDNWEPVPILSFHEALDHISRLCSELSSLTNITDETTTTCIVQVACYEKCNLDI